MALSIIKNTMLDQMLLITLEILTVFLNLLETLMKNLGRVKSYILATLLHMVL